MNIIHSFYNLILDALFPLSSTERELFSYTPEQALTLLPPAPDYSRLAVPLPHTHSLFAYKDPRVSALIWNIKYKKSEPAVVIAGYALTQTLQKEFAQRPLLIVPLPITNRRRKERGFNQCELIIEEMKKLTSKDSSIYYSDSILERIHHDDRHTLKGRRDRVESASGIFAVDEEIAEKFMVSFKNTHTPLRDMSIIVIDDVITTGSTMQEAISTLKKYG
ncbi:MAG: hypothetical protein WCG07_03470, partial [Candidatus Taylorbacteria bacterium]